MTIGNWSEIDEIDGSRFLGVSGLWLVMSLHILAQSKLAVVGIIQSSAVHDLTGAVMPRNTMLGREVVDFPGAFHD